jgi:hypothetical protein
MRCTVKARAFPRTATLSLRTGRPPQPLGFRIWHQVSAFARNRVAICELYARVFQSFFLKGSLCHDPRRIWLGSCVSCRPLLADARRRSSSSINRC